MIILAFILAIVGILGAIYPVIPAVLVSYGALVALFFSDKHIFSLTELIIWGVGMVVVSLVDAIMAPLITKRMGGSKLATKGSFIGVIVGSFFFPPFGMILGAFFGALLGEISETKKLDNHSVKIALGSFLGFILGTGLKLIFSVTILIMLIFKLL